MKTATICARSRDAAPGYEWVWRCNTDGVVSTSAFDFYYDCITDARNHGYDVGRTSAHGNSAPGGAGYRLRD
jgi:hypothetical protein